MTVSHPETTVDLDEMIIRQVKKTDLPALEWEGEYQHYRPMFADLYRQTRVGRTLMWVIETPQSEIIGQAFVLLKSSERDAADGRDRAYVFAFRIKPQWRNKGIGKYLMDFIETDLRQRGFKTITLNVAKDNHDALRLYHRLGYQVMGPRAGRWSYRDHLGEVHHVNEPAWRMMKELGE